MAWKRSSTRKIEVGQGFSGGRSGGQAQGAWLGQRAGFLDLTGLDTQPDEAPAEQFALRASLEE